MQRILVILSLPTENVKEMMKRLDKDNFEPDYLPDINHIPSNRMNISLEFSINSKSMLEIAKRIFREFHATIEIGPIDKEPNFKRKFKQHVGKVWKETLVLLVEGWAAAHAATGAFIVHNNLNIEELHYPNIEIFGIGSVAAGIYFIYSHTKYQKIVED